MSLGHLPRPPLSMFVSSSTAINLGEENPEGPTCPSQRSAAQRGGDEGGNLVLVQLGILDAHYYFTSCTSGTVSAQ